MFKSINLHPSNLFSPQNLDQYQQTHFNLEVRGRFFAFDVLNEFILPVYTQYTQNSANGGRNTAMLRAIGTVKTHDLDAHGHDHDDDHHLRDHARHHQPAVDLKYSGGDLEGVGVNVLKSSGLYFLVAGLLQTGAPWVSYFVSAIYQPQPTIHCRQ